MGSLLEIFLEDYDDLFEYGLQHLFLVAVAIVCSTIIGVGVGMLTYRRPRERTIALGVAGVILTIPSLALFVLLVPLFGLGSVSALVALTLYGLLPILRNTIVGLNEVDAAVVESATGMGLRRRQVMREIELPLAWPVIITGVRVSAMIIVGIAAIAAVIQAGGFGEIIFRSLSQLGSTFAVDGVLLGTFGVIILAILIDLLFALINRLTTPRGIRR